MGGKLVTALFRLLQSVCLGSFSFWCRFAGKTQSLPSPRVWIPHPRACWARVGMSEAHKAEPSWALVSCIDFGCSRQALVSVFWM